MKKILLAILLLFTLVACGNLETYHTPPALKKGQKTVRLVNFPIAFEGSLTKELEKKGWDVYVGNTGNQAIKVECSNFDFDMLYGFRQGSLKFIDLRTGKEIARYKFRIADPDNVQKEIVKILESIPGA
ncbi:hypothetical protein [Fusobacterium polymorphum]|uniref:hypothetical protein n=1 Tax=Fusobacterium nucleatum subsp. polymorphum TaxID=76857 RepID=UPI003008E74A